MLGILISYNLWIPDRFFPLIPIFSSLEIYRFLGWMLLFALISSLFLLVFYSSRIVLFIAILAMLGLVLIDLLRLQPWVYIYFSIFLFLTVMPKSPEGSLNCIQLICIGVYIWSGVHKINSNFLDMTFKSTLQTIFSIHEDHIIESLKKLGYLIPGIEIICGLLLFFKRARRIGVLTAIIIHVSIIIFLGPLGINKNFVVIPWNIAMIIVVFAAFYKSENKIFYDNDNFKTRILRGMTVLLFWIAPLFNFFSSWDSYLSFSLYSDKVNAYYIAVEESEVYKIDHRLRSYFIKLPNMKGGQLIDIDKWSTTELHVPFYPEDRVFKKLSRSFCKLGIDNEKLIFLKVSNYPKKGQYFPFKCNSL